MSPQEPRPPRERCPQPVHCVRCRARALRPEGARLTEAEKWLEEREWPEDHWDPLVMDEFHRRFAFAVPSAAALAAVVPHSPILEVGAGSGYWAMELALAGADITATDPRRGGFHQTGPEWHQTGPEWHQVERIPAEEAIGLHPGRSLLMCWPPRGGWCTQALREFPGETVVYVGEDARGCTGGLEFHVELEDRFRLVEEVQIPRFIAMSDRLQVWQVK